MKGMNTFNPLASIGVQYIPGHGYVANTSQQTLAPTTARNPQSRSALSGEADVMMISGLGKGLRGLGAIQAPFDIPWWGWFATGAVLSFGLMWVLSKR